mgnify:CR=1 FL=1
MLSPSRFPNPMYVPALILMVVSGWTVVQSVPERRSTRGTAIASAVSCS